MSFEGCLKKRFLIRIHSDLELSAKEFLIANEDLERSKHTKNVDNNFKWAIIQAYYSMFHAAKAILYQIGLKERSHRCVADALEKLSGKGLIEPVVIEQFKSCMESREDADYRSVYSEEEANRTVEIAEEFLKKMIEISKKVKPNEI
jgi:uncharacterized protein (UPF0332 family)